MLSAELGLSVGNWFMSCMLRVPSSTAPPPIGLEEGVSIMVEKSGGLEKFTGKFTSGMLGGKLLRLGVIGCVALLGVDSVVKGFVCGVVVSGGCEARATALFCGNCWIVSLSAPIWALATLLGFRLCLEPFSDFSRTMRAIRSNSEQTPSMRLTPPCSSASESNERKLTT